MDATPISPDHATPLGGGPSASGQPPFGPEMAMSARWSALHDAASAARALAELPDEPLTPAIRGFPDAMRSAGGWRLDMARQGIEDLMAVLQPGLSALLTAHARGGDIAPPALALWREFQSARDTLLLALVPPDARESA